MITKHSCISFQAHLVPRERVSKVDLEVADPPGWLACMDVGVWLDPRDPPATASSVTLQRGRGVHNKARST